MQVYIMPEIAIFPIPDCVSFPGTVFPLHVFEPRYRSMIKYCLDNNQLLGIAHTQKIVSQGKADQSLEEALSSNQTTYKPFPVFSAGRCELLKVLDDGRMYLQVHMESRFIKVSEKQTLPFSICQCDPYLDAEENIDLPALELLKQKVLNRLIVMTSNIPEIQKILASEQWAKKEAIAFSFEIFALFQLEADMQQNILEMSSASERLEYLLGLLNTKNNY